MANSAPIKVKHPFTVALTGGIASGKSLVSDEFAALGVPVIDTDVIAHQVVEPGKPALQKIKDCFGDDVIDTDGRLNRSCLRSLIFSDPQARSKLESILHPIIRQEAIAAIAKVTDAYCVLVVPLLTEKGNYPNVHRILVVDVSAETQIDRLMNRDKSSRKQAHQALASQASRAERIKIADDVLDNSASPEHARNKVAVLHSKYLKLAAAANTSMVRPFFA